MALPSQRSPGSGLQGARAAVFDAYGTLFDVASASRRAKEVLGPKWEAVSDLWRAKQLQYTWLRSLMGRHADFWRVTSDALGFALESLGLGGPDLHERLMSLFERLDAFPDARPALERLRETRIRIAVLSNGAPRMLAAVAKSSGLEPLLDDVISVEQVGTYKPSPAVYRLAADRLGLWPAEIAFVSANGWDACGAKASGLRVAWCNRAGEPQERIPESPDVEIRSLAELPALLGA